MGKVIPFPRQASGAPRPPLALYEPPFALQPMAGNFDTGHPTCPDCGSSYVYASRALQEISEAVLRAFWVYACNACGWVGNRPPGVVR